MKSLTISFAIGWAWLGLWSAFAGQGDAPVAFDTYYMVFLKRGPLADQIPEEKLAEIQKGHLAHLTSLMEAGHIKVAGPFEASPDGELRGVVIFPGGMSQERVRALAESDPAVKAGRLTVAIHKWWVPKGVLTWNPEALETQ